MQISHFTYKQGVFEPSNLPILDPEPVTMDAASLQLPTGVYTTFRTFTGLQSLFIEQHFERLEHSMQLIGHRLSLTPDSFRAVLRQCVQKSGFDPARVRVSFTPLGEDQFDCYIMVGALKLPAPALYQNGVKVLTRQLHRDNSEAKVTQFIKNTDGLRKAIGGDINEILMVDNHERFLEGFSSNIFCVRGNQIWTAEAGVLPGLTRSAVVRIIQEKNIALNLEGYPLNKLQELDEIFITSTSRNVLPVVWVDEVRIGKGLPGPLTHEIGTAYEQFVLEHLQAL